MLLGDYTYIKTIDCNDGTCEHCNKQHLKYYSILQDKNGKQYNVGTTCRKKIINKDYLRKIENSQQIDIIKRNISTLKKISKVNANINDYVKYFDTNWNDFGVMLKSEYIENKSFGKTYIYSNDIKLLAQDDKLTVMKLYNTIQKA